MKAKMINECHIEGLLYESKLEMKVTGEKLILQLMMLAIILCQFILLM